MSRAEDKCKKYSVLKQRDELPHKEEEAGNIVVRDDCTSYHHTCFIH